MERIQIWNDNQRTSNYNLFFDVENQESPPDKIVLTAKDDDKNKALEKWIFELVGKAYIDRKDEELQTKNTEQDMRLDSIDTKNTEQDTRLTNIEELNRTQENRLHEIENDNNTQDIRLGQLETITANHNTRLDDIDGLNGSQTNRLDSIDTKNTEQDTRLTQLEESDKKAIEHVFEHEYTLPQVRQVLIDNLDDGLYSVKSNLIIRHTERDSIPLLGWIYKKGKQHFATFQKCSERNSLFGDVNATIINTGVSISLISKKDITSVINECYITDSTYTKISFDSDIDIELNSGSTREVKKLSEWLQLFLDKVNVINITNEIPASDIDLMFTNPDFMLNSTLDFKAFKTRNNEDIFINISLKYNTLKTIVTQTSFNIFDNIKYKNEVIGTNYFCVNYSTIENKDNFNKYHLKNVLNSSLFTLDVLKNDIAESQDNILLLNIHFKRKEL